MKKKKDSPNDYFPNRNTFCSKCVDFLSGRTTKTELICKVDISWTITWRSIDLQMNRWRVGGDWRTMAFRWAPCPCVPDKGESASGLERNPDQVHSSHTQLSPPHPPTPPSSCDARALTGVKRKTQCCQNKKRQRAWGHRRTKDTSGIGLRPLTKCHLWILFTIASSRKSCRCKHVRATLLVIFPGREYDLIELRNWKSLWDKVTTPPPHKKYRKVNDGLFSIQDQIWVLRYKVPGRFLSFWCFYIEKKWPKKIPICMWHQKCYHDKNKVSIYFF